jgi:hypothetical protein
MGAFMSVTAFPVLARILAERRLLRSRIGAMNHRLCRAPQTSPPGASWPSWSRRRAPAGTAARWSPPPCAVAYDGAMLLLVRPLLVRLAARVATPDAMSQNVCGGGS